MAETWSTDVAKIVELSGHATLLGRKEEGPSVLLKGEGLLLVFYQLKQQKTVEETAAAMEIAAQTAAEIAAETAAATAEA